MERNGEMRKCARKKAHKQPKCKRPYTRELPWAACGCIWGDIWDKITPEFTVKSSFHLRNKEDSKFSICAPCKCSCNCHGRARHKPRDFQNLKGKVAANALDISVTLFDAIDLENSTFILTRRGAEAILFLTKAEIANSNKTGKSSASIQTNPVEWHPKFIRSITHAPRLSVKAPRPRWKASQSRCARALVEKHIFLNRRRRSEQGNYTSNIQLGALSV